MGQHSTRVLSLTLMRPLRTRWRDVDTSSAKNEDLLRKVLEALTSLLTGHIRERGVAHLCPGCCDNVEHCAEKLTDALVAGFVELLSNMLPSTSKHCTMGEIQRVEAGLFLVRSLGEDLLSRAIGEIDAQDNEEEDGAALALDDVAEFRRMCSRKARQARDAALDQEHRVSVVQSVWASEPVEKLDNALQHGDAVVKSLLDATYDQGPVYQAEVELLRRATSSPKTDFPLSFLVRHFEEEADFDIRKFERDSFGQSVSIAAQLWSL
jgi:hypothetical protein